MQFSTSITPAEGNEGPIILEWQLATSSDFAAAHVLDTGTTTTSATASWQATAETNDLHPGAKYYYRFLLKGKEVGHGQTQTIWWQDTWGELDLIFGLAVDTAGSVTTLDPVKYNITPRDHIQLPSALVMGSPGQDVIHIGVDSEIIGGKGDDIFMTSDSQGGNKLVGGDGTDEFYLKVINDTVIGGSQIVVNGTPGHRRQELAVGDHQRDMYLIDTSSRTSESHLIINDFQVDTDQLFIDGIEARELWPDLKSRLLSIGVSVNAAPETSIYTATLDLVPGVQTSIDLGGVATDLDGDPLQLVILEGPTWMEARGTTLKAQTPADFSEASLTELSLDLAVTDGEALTRLPKSPSIRLLSNQFVNGVASGDPFQDSVILWTRVNPETVSGTSALVIWQVSTTEDFRGGTIVDNGSFITDASRDWTVKVEADGLQPGKSYYYRFVSNGGASPTGQTRTLAKDAFSARIALFSCANFTAEPEFAVYGKAAEINKERPYDAWVHVGDYIYEYGKGGYTAAEGSAESRGFKPEKELVTLDDYRQRYAQYHTDSNLQALRQGAPLIAIWDDHETANDSYAKGAQNHQNESEGDWATRVSNAIRAYHEWMPIREQTPQIQAYRSFNFGDVLSLHMLETRLIARDQQLSYNNAVSSADIAAIVKEAYSGDRTMIGDQQLAWLGHEMATSKATWQALGSGTLMANMAIPAELLLNSSNPAVVAKYAEPLQKLAQGIKLSADEQSLFDESRKIPYNLDAWDGYGAEREHIIDAALALGKKIVSLAGDTHNAWGSVLDSSTGEKVGVEFAGPGVSSPGLESISPNAAIIEKLFRGYVSDLRYAELNNRGFVDLTFTPESVTAEYNFLTGTDAASQQYEWKTDTLYTDASLHLAELVKQAGLVDFSATNNRNQPVILNVSSLNRGGRLYEQKLLPRSGDFRLRLDEGGFSADLPEDSDSRDVIQLDFTLGRALQNVAVDERVKDERGALESIAEAARGIVSGAINNYIHTRDGEDRIIGSPGIDFIRAGAGDDFVDAGLGNDIVRSGSGNDTVLLGGGADQLLITRDQLSGTDMLYDFAPTDSLVLADSIRVLGGIGTSLLRVGFTSGNQQELLLTGTSVAAWSMDFIRIL